MARSFQPGVYLVRVLTDDRTHRLWVAAGSSPEDAVGLVLDAIPEGWSASPALERLTPAEIDGLNLRQGDVQEIVRTIRRC
ncbi:hypothetical protein G8O24_40225 [Bradyrhizobium sp. INPA01-394B]|uniref:DUF1902 domain-containing protein n=1 Tax=Bradyrhizobium campsiandrae TaxID=1729892 RepID=A0ABR7UIV4_9BRAD|nr:hypothetical protein [Bradyrhizobium campsiandrae]MBC9883517.1 hypothetical protein [Bradyrhizobium campsiandrae]MBC9983890.1 hypothetical protein [Bradyrhizobium campsiandrae]